MTEPTFELFACKDYAIRLSRTACAANYKMMNSGAKTTMQGTAVLGTGTSKGRVYGRIHCVDCKVGEAHAAGKVVPVERMTWKRDAVASSAPPAPPMTVVPRVEGLLGDVATKTPKSAPRVAPIPPPPPKKPAPSFDELIEAARQKQPTPEAKESPMPRVYTPPKSTEQRAAIIADTLERKISIGEYADKHGVSEQTLRNWLKAEGHAAIGWPVRGSSTLGPKAAKPLTLEGEPMPPPTPRVMERTELADEGDELPDTQIPFVPTPAGRLASIIDDETILVPRVVGSMLARIDATGTVTHVAQCLYMSGLALGQGNTKSAAKWIERAGWTVSETETRANTRGAA